MSWQIDIIMCNQYVINVEGKNDKVWTMIYIIHIVVGNWIYKVDGSKKFVDNFVLFLRWLFEAI